MFYKEYLYHLTFSPTVHRVAFSPCSFQYLFFIFFFVFCVFFMLATLTGMKWHFIAVLIYIYLKNSDVEGIDSYPLWPFVTFLWIDVYWSYLPIFNQVFSHKIIGLLYTFWIVTTYQIYCLQIYSSCCGLPFDLWLLPLLCRSFLV